MTNNKQIKIATRKSPLAIWQAKYVQQQLSQLYPDIHCTILGQTTTGDAIQNIPLNRIGGKNLFVKELQQMLINKQADIAVHSLKDLSANSSPNLHLAAVCKREDPRDVLIANHPLSPENLPDNIIIGTNSPRRQSQIKAQHPKIKLQSLRGNIGTRLNKLENNQFDAIILAAAGIKRLKLTSYITAYFDPLKFVPAIGQGVIGIECRQSDQNTIQLLTPLNDQSTYMCITAERAVNQILAGDCFSPIAAYATLKDTTLHLTALVGDIAGNTILRTEATGHPSNAAKLGFAAANDLLEQGADTLLHLGG